jgi:hypothetical protein
MSKTPSLLTTFFSEFQHLPTKITTLFYEFQHLPTKITTFFNEFHELPTKINVLVSLLHPPHPTPSHTFQLMAHGRRGRPGPRGPQERPWGMPTSTETHKPMLGVVSQQRNPNPRGVTTTFFLFLYFLAFRMLISSILKVNFKFSSRLIFKKR